MQLDALRGNAATREALRTALTGGRLPHAVLLTAPPGAGADFAARCLAADYLYPKGGAAARAVLEGRSPEVLLVEGEGKSGGIRVDRIRAVRAEVFHSALSAHGRVVHIRDAQRMAAPAANALLKVLEEPPPGVLFLLTGHDAAALPATIRSRCALYPLSPVSPAECEAALAETLPAGADAELPALLAAVYGGRIGAGLAVLGDEKRFAVLRDALALAEAAAAGDRYTLLRLLAGYEGRDKAGESAESERRAALLGDWADILAACLRGGRAPGLPGIPPAACAALLPPLQQTRISLTRNAAVKTAFTALVVELGKAVDAKAV